MATETVKIIRHTRCRSYDPQNMIDRHHALRMCERHFQRSEANYVEVNGRMCWCLHQAETQIRRHFH